MRRGFIRSGLLAILGLSFAGCVRQQEATGPLPAFSEYEGREVANVSFTGDLQLPEDSLQAVIRTRASRCRVLFLPVCLPFNIGRDDRYLELTEVSRDVARLLLYYRDHGYYGAVVVPFVAPTVDDPEEVDVTFDITAGRPVVLTDLEIVGIGQAVAEEDVAAALPLEVGQPFGRADFFASADTITSRLLQNGFAYATVLRNFSIDTIADVASAEFETLSGPLVSIDTIIFRGNERLTERTLRRQLAIDEGEVLRETDLARSQRNLYNLEMVNFASVQIAPDSMQLDPDRSAATVLVQVVESAQYAVETSVGFGTVECFRTGGQWANRNFLGGGRLLEVRAALSRIGVGQPLDLGLGGNLCTELGEETFLGLEVLDLEDRVDYNIGLAIQQPSIFGTQNRVAFEIEAERLSEPDAYVREAVGGRITIARQFDTGPTVVTTTAEVGRGKTVANPVILCVGFDTCSPNDFELLSQARWSNSLGIAAVRDATRSDGVETRGYVVRGTVDWASEALGSDDRYLRVVADGARYRMVRPGWMFATRLRVGRFLQVALGPDEGYIPPEKRFYAGGPTSVRGYGRNQLGPTSYVTPVVDGEATDTIGSATGGTQLIEASAELRIPAPWLSDIARLAFFVDAGHVSAPGSEFSISQGLRFTPGVGVRFATPVGPFRLDLAYNPYPPEIGPLYRADPFSGLILIEPEYQPASSGFLRRLRLQFALGQAF
jgi:outer membrane protein insertion porin family